MVRPAPACWRWPVSTTRRVSSLLLALVLALGPTPWPLPPPPAWSFTGASPAAASASFTVNSTDDTPDAHPGDGVCATAAGVCTSRAAIQEANALGSAVTVTF